MLKKFVFFISLLFFSNITILSAEIIPLKKPLQTKEEKDQKLLIDVMKPFLSAKSLVKVVFPAPDGDERIIIIPSFIGGIKN